MVHTSDDSSLLLEEVAAADEAQLQELVKSNPGLLPIEEFGMTGPLMVVGKETSLPSGAVDLVALARSGELLVIEFKTGPQNSDFRHALAQLLDYGSDLWRMTYEDFESTVPVRYFASDHCAGSPVHGFKSLQRAMAEIWTDLSDEEVAAIRDRLSQQLKEGFFHYVLAAQRFTPTMERAMDYLNSTMRGPRFYAVEVVRFQGDSVSAFESRTVLKPTRGTGGGGPTQYTNEEEFFEGIQDEAYRSALRQLLEACRGLGLRFEWGSLGVSIRLPTTDRPEPLTIAWIFPPGRAGWMSLTDVTCGFDQWSADRHPSTPAALKQYLASIRTIKGVEDVKPKSLRGTAYRIPPSVLVSLRTEVTEILAKLVINVSGGE